MWTMIAPPTAPERPGSLVGQLLRHRSVQIVIAVWLLANVAVVVVAGGRLPFDRPAVADKPFASQLIFANLGLVEVLLLIALTWYLTRRRQIPDMAARAPGRDLARRETLGLIGYGVLVQAGGALLGTALGWRPISFHLAGTIYGTHAHITRTEAITWALYNVVLYAVVPYLFFRRRYSNEQLNLKSTDRRNDLLVIVVILVVESLVEIFTVSSAFFDMSPSQMLIGGPLAFVLYFAGTVLPTMVFIYAILLPRYLKLTGSAVAAAILGGVTYTLVHFLDAWLVYTSASAVLLSMIFLFFQYFGPGVIKSVLTLRTGNAWVHAIAYHSVAPHVFVDAPHVVHVFGVR
jgi:hypothetical protein